MDITPLADVRPGRLDYVLCVRISRMWEFRGTNEQNEIKHLDLVVIDEKAVPMYAEIAAEVVPFVRPYLEEGKIVYMAKITIERAKPGYRAVENPYMIRLNKRTCIFEANDQPLSFPKYTFSLTPFESLDGYVGKTDKFLDVIGKIIAVSNAATVDQTKRRIVKMQDLRGNTVDISLTGKRATEFDGETVLNVGQKCHVIAIFVGTLMKQYRFQFKFLSGTSACRWYINHNDIPEIKAFQKSLPLEVEPIQSLHLEDNDNAQQNYEQKTLLQLKNVDPFLEKEKKFEFTVTIVGTTRKQPWCYRACKSCNSKIILYGTTYKCTKDGCYSTQFNWKYKIPFIASDNTCALEFMLFEKTTSELIGKPAEALRKHYDILDTPPDISACIGHKFTFIVRILSNKSINKDDPSFEVVMIKQRFGKQLHVPSAQVQSTSTAEIDDLPPLVPILSQKKDTQVSSSQVIPSPDIHDMEIDTTRTVDSTTPTFSSNKRIIEEIETSDQISDEEHLKDTYQPKSKKPRSEEKRKV